MYNSKKDENSNFYFSTIFSSTDGQEKVWLNIKPDIHEAMNGFNVSIFAYGGYVCLLFWSMF